MIAAPVETIASDLSCLHCGYNLRGLTATGRCPECGKPVLDTLRGTTLHRAAPAALLRLRRGLYFLLAASALALLAALCSSDRVLPIQSLGGGSARAWLLDVAIYNSHRAGVLVLSAVSLCFYTIGIFAISSPLGLYPGRTQRRGLELALSVGGIVPLPLFVVGLIQFELMQFIAWIILAIGDLAQSFVFLLFLQQFTRTSRLVRLASGFRVALYLAAGRLLIFFPVAWPFPGLVSDIACGVLSAILMVVLARRLGTIARDNRRRGIPDWRPAMSEPAMTIR